MSAARASSKPSEPTPEPEPTPDAQPAPDATPEPEPTPDATPEPDAQPAVPAPDSGYVATGDVAYAYDGGRYDLVAGDYVPQDMADDHDAMAGLLACGAVVPAEQ